jgi:hypothetical protein
MEAAKKIQTGQFIVPVKILKGGTAEYKPQASFLERTYSAVQDDAKVTVYL